MTAIVLNRMRKTFGNRDLFTDFNLIVEENEMIAIRGASGSGKSTLLNIIGLIEPFDAGSLQLFNRKEIIINSKQATLMMRSKINYLFQNFALIDEETVEENLVMSLHYIKKSNSQKSQLIREALRKVGLESFADKKIFQLSGGEQQRVALARIFLKPGKLILADEPTGSLDEDNRDRVLSILKELNELGNTIVIVTHDEVVAQACHRCIQLK